MRSAPAVIVVAIGGGASNTLNHLLRAGGAAADLLAANTDVQDLRRSLAPSKLQLGAALVRGLGSGGDPERGAECALADRSAIATAIADASLVVILAGLGGGTGSGAAPVVAEIASELGGVAVAVVTMPWRFEGRRRALTATHALEALRARCDGLVPIANDALRRADAPSRPMQDAFAAGDAASAAAIRELLGLVATAPSDPDAVRAVARTWIAGRT